MLYVTSVQSYQWLTSRIRALELQHLQDLTFCAANSTFDTKILYFKLLAFTQFKTRCDRMLLIMSQSK
ncbi:hypothetical protein C7B80_18580 [Cyanosarcina cf. burmensis CCALA 770]|nr:hypothetical protein C7B80_18580 [Cyanosarcina cf. burmensis CCALA 770]